MDAVITDFNRELLRIWREQHPDKMFIAIEELREWDCRNQYPAEYSKDIQKICHSPGFFRNLPPVEGALEALDEIYMKFEYTFLCSSPIPGHETCIQEKFYWVKENLGEEWTSRIIFTKDKTIIKGDILIDDKPEVIGMEEPEWEHVIFDQPYNRNIVNKRRMTWKNWKTIIR